MKQVESTLPVKKTYKPNDPVKRNQNEIYKIFIKYYYYKIISVSLV